MTQSEKQKIY